MGLGLRERVFVHPSQMRRPKVHHLLSLALHPLLNTAQSESKGGGVLRIRQRRACVYVAGELVQDDDECEPSARRLSPPVKLPPSGLFEEGGEQLGYLLADLWSSLEPAQHLLPEGFGIGIIAWEEPVREDLLGVDDRPRLAHSVSFFRFSLALLQHCLQSEELSNMQHPGEEWLPYCLYSPRI